MPAGCPPDGDVVSGAVELQLHELSVFVVDASDGNLAAGYGSDLINVEHCAVVGFDRWPLGGMSAGDEG